MSTISGHHDPKPISDKMRKHLKRARHSMVLRILLSVGAVLFVSIGIWAFYNIRHYHHQIIEDRVAECDRLGEAVRLGTHYAMMFNAREDINQIIHNMSKMEGISHVRVYDKNGQIRFSNIAQEVGRVTDIKAEACIICHRTTPPRERLDLDERKRIFMSAAENQRFIGVISPIYNAPGCATADCHAHPKNTKVLGALDVAISLKKTDAHLTAYRNRVAVLAVCVFLAALFMIFFILMWVYIEPIRKLILGTRQIASGKYDALKDFRRKDEIGYLAGTIDRMGQNIGRKQRALNRQKNEYQRLFELVPCIITVQDKNYKLIGYNQEFSMRFDPRPGDFCYSAYKGRTEKCEFCPVEKTFQDGKPHYSEETGRNKDGSLTHWIVKTAALKNERGEVIGAMEMSLDITHKKQLENKLKQSEKQYYAIFNNIPNPVFVLDADTLEIIDGNDSIRTVYGYRKEELLHRSFLELFAEDEKDRYRFKDRVGGEINQVKQQNKKGEVLYVNIRISPSEYPGRKALLVTTSDITERLETEMQLIQAGKMATLGEMATGVAHELNQPLSVIKTASSFFMKKIRKKEAIRDDILFTMASEIDHHVDRASNIITHLREFGRKSELRLEKVQVNDVLKSAFEIFSQQLKLREIEVVWRLMEDLPPVDAEGGRLEQVIINLLINARDAIEEKWEAGKTLPEEVKQIGLNTFVETDKVVIEVWDTGAGIPKAVLGRIFEPFFTTKKVGQGTGLGLSISYSIIKEFKGSLQATSDGRNTCFTIKIPVAEAA